MTSTIFEDWLKKLNRKMFLQKRKILLFIDNAPSHPTLNFSNVKVVFFLANTTSNLQPMDQGVIQNVKVQYRKLLLRELLLKLEECHSVTELIKKVTVLDAVNWICEAWDNVTPLTIQRCFRKAGFSIDIDTNEDIEDDLPLSELAALLRRAAPAIGMDVLAAEAFVSADESVPTSEDNDADPGWRMRILDKHQGETAEDNIVNESDNDDDTEASPSDSEPAVRTISSKEAVELIKQLEAYALNSEPGLLKRVQELRSHHDAIRLDNLMNKSHQSTIEQCFLLNR